MLEMHIQKVQAKKKLYYISTSVKPKSFLPEKSPAFFLTNKNKKNYQTNFRFILTSKKHGLLRNGFRNISDYIYFVFLLNLK